RQADGVLVTWNGAYEPESLGFYVHRGTSASDRMRLNRDLIRSSALQSGVFSFSWVDAAPGWTGPVSYWIEDVDVSGASTWYGPVSPDGAAGSGRDASADAFDLDPRAGGCVIVAPPRNAALQVVLVAALIFGLRRGRRRWLVVTLYVVAVIATSVSRPRPA